MSYNLTDWFKEQLSIKAPDRQFSIDFVDYSSKVVRWPKIKNTWDGVKPQSITLQLSNEDKDLNFIQNLKTTLSTVCELKLGYTHPQSGGEYITLFNGTMDKVRYSKGICSITFRDKFKQLTERNVGLKDTPAVFSVELPSDIAWAAVTSYGGFSSVQSTSNPDIDWQSFQDWAAVFSADGLQMSGVVESRKVSDVLKTISLQTMSGIYVENNRLTFQRFSAVNTITHNVDDDYITDLTLSIDDEDIVNRQYVYGGYDVDSQEWGIQTFHQSSESIVYYGQREQVEKSKDIWYISSASCQNLAQRVISLAGEPYDNISIKAPFAAGLVQIGETVILSDTWFDGNLSGGYRIMSYVMDMNKAEVILEVDKTQVGIPFILDQSTLDGTDQLL
jgi:hypothetical protein